MRFQRWYLTGQLDPERAPESPSGIVRLGTVVVQEDGVVAPIAEQRATALPDLGGCLHPAGRGGIELTNLLEPPILVHRQQCGAHGIGHVDSLVLGLCSFRASSASRS